MDHDEGLGQVLPVKLVAVVGALVRTVVEHLQEGRSTQVEHELQGGREKRHDRTGEGVALLVVMVVLVVVMLVLVVLAVVGGADLGVEGEGLREPEGVRVIFVVVAKLLTLLHNKHSQTDSCKHKVGSKMSKLDGRMPIVMYIERLLYRPPKSIASTLI